MNFSPRKEIKKGARLIKKSLPKKKKKIHQVFGHFDHGYVWLCKKDLPLAPPPPPPGPTPTWIKKATRAIHSHWVMYNYIIIVRGIIFFIKRNLSNAT